MMGTGIVIIIAIVTLIAGVIWLRRIHLRSAHLLSAIKQLNTALQDYSDGQHQTRLPIPDVPELRALASAFNQMADTEQHQTIEAQQRQHHLNDMLDSMGDAVIATDAEGRVTHMNLVAEKLTGWAQTEAVGKPVETVLTLLDSINRSTAPMPVRTALSTGKNVPPSGHTLLVLRDNSERHLTNSCAPIRDVNGHITGAIMVCRDTSEEFLLRETLQEKEAAYRLFAEQSPSFDYWLDENGGYRYISPSCERITGYPADQFVSGLNFIEQMTHPDDQALVHEHSVDVKNPGLPQHAMEFRIITRQGEVRWIHHICQDSFDANGKWLGRRASNLDITARKEAEIALSEQAEGLQQLVDERTHQLQQSNNELAHAARAKDEFLAAMSHELRTPLSAILGLSEILKNETVGPLNAKQKRYLRQVEESGRHLLDLINEILDIAKIEAGKFSLNVDDINTLQLVESSMNMVREAARSKNLHIALAEDGRVTRLRADPLRIKQALVNLLSNAVKFTPEGGRFGLDVFGDDNRNEVRFVVWDSGIGISPEEQARLFQPFIQIDSQLSRQYTGTGLGLVMAKHMAELHGGRIEMESSPGKGSRFTFILPWHPGQVAPLTAPMAPNPSSPTAPEDPMGPRTVLMVDDNEVNLEIAREFLEGNGHQVSTAVNGEEALALLENAPLPDVVFMDVQMPVMDGPTTLAHIRANPKTAHLHVIALTALAMTGDRDRLLNMGFDDYLAKPFQFNTLEALVMQCAKSGVTEN